MEGIVEFVYCAILVCVMCIILGMLFDIIWAAIIVNIIRRKNKEMKGREIK